MRSEDASLFGVVVLRNPRTENVSCLTRCTIVHKYYLRRLKSREDISNTRCAEFQKPEKTREKRTIWNANGSSDKEEEKR